MCRNSGISRCNITEIIMCNKTETINCTTIGAMDKIIWGDFHIGAIIAAEEMLVIETKVIRTEI